MIRLTWLTIKLGFWLFRLWPVLVILSLGGAASAQSGDAPRLDLHRLLPDTGGAASVRVALAPGLKSTRDLADPALQAARKRMFDGDPVSVADLRALADRGDPNAAMRLIETLAAQGIAADPANIAHYYGIAASTGRLDGLYRLMDTLDGLRAGDLSAARAAHLKKIVTAYAAAGNPKAADALLRYHETGHPFGAIPDTIAALARAGNEAAVLDIVSAQMQTGWRDAETLRLTQFFLKAASQSDSVRVQLFSQTMLSVLDDRIASLMETTGPKTQGE